MTTILVPQGGEADFFNAVAAVGCGTFGHIDNQSITWHVAGTFSNIYANIKTNTCNADTTSTIYINGSAGNETLFIAANATGEFQDTTHSDTISSGATMGYNVPNGFGTIEIMTFCTNFAPTTTGNTVVKYLSVNGNAYSNYGSYFNAPGGIYAAIVGSESYAAFNMKTAGTNKNLYAYAPSNSKTNPVTITSRINYGGGNLSITIPATTTGTFEDTTHTDTVVSGDTMDYATTVPTGLTSVTIDLIGCEFVTANSAMHYVSGINDSDEVITYNTTGYMPIVGRGMDTMVATESQAQIKSNVSFTISFLQSYVARNDINSTTTISMRIASASGNETLSISAGASGLFTDSTHTDSVISGNELDYEFSTVGSSSGAFSSTNFGILASYVPASTASDAIWFGMTF